MQTKRKINMVVKNITHTSTQSTHTHIQRNTPAQHTKVCYKKGTYSRKLPQQP